MKPESLSIILIILAAQTYAFQVSKDSIYSPVFTNDTSYLVSTLSVNAGVFQEIIDSIKYTDTNETVITGDCGTGSLELQLALDKKVLLCSKGSNCITESLSCNSEKDQRYAKDTLRIGTPKKLSITSMGACVALCPVSVDVCPCSGCSNKINDYGKLILYSKNGIKRQYLIGPKYLCMGSYKNPLITSAISYSTMQSKLSDGQFQKIIDGRVFYNKKDVSGKVISQNKKESQINR
jgi:hypothetical protein